MVKKPATMPAGGLRFVRVRRSFLTGTRVRCPLGSGAGVNTGGPCPSAVALSGEPSPTRERRRRTKAVAPARRRAG